MLLSCSDKNTDFKEIKTNLDTASPVSEVDTIKNIETMLSDSTIKSTKDKLVVADKTKYSKKFLEGLMNTPSDYEFKLKDSVLTIVGQGDAIIPNVIPINEKIKFVGKRDNETFDLLVGRINYSAIAFELKILKSGKQVSFENGTADIGSMFFLASEIDADEKTGVSYSSYEYYGELNGCNFSFRIGVGEDDGKRRAKIIRSCPNKSKNIDLDYCPTLYAK